MSAKCQHRWIFRESQDGLLFVRFCPKCTICEYIDQNRSWSTMRDSCGPDRCPSTFRRGMYRCKKDIGHLYRVGDVEHQNSDIKWMTV